jgi:hypothetical protein
MDEPAQDRRHNQKPKRVTAINHNEESERRKKTALQQLPQAGNRDIYQRRDDVACAALACTHGAMTRSDLPPPCRLTKTHSFSIEKPGGLRKLLRIMSSLSIEKFGHNLPASSLAGVSQAAVGFGAGLLLASYLKSNVRDKLAIASLTGGTAILLPVLVGIVARLTNNPNSARRVRKQLESIRHDSGLVDGESELV